MCPGRWWCRLHNTTDSDSVPFAPSPLAYPCLFSSCKRLGSCSLSCSQDAGHQLAKPCFTADGASHTPIASQCVSKSEHREDAGQGRSAARSVQGFRVTCTAAPSPSLKQPMAADVRAAVNSSNAKRKRREEQGVAAKEISHCGRATPFLLSAPLRCSLLSPRAQASTSTARASHSPSPRAPPRLCSTPLVCARRT